MGCKQSLNIKRHSYLQDTEGRPIEKIFDETILINTLPKYVVEFFQLYSYHRLKYIKGE